jgi:hypothetical protein
VGGGPGQGPMVGGEHPRFPLNRRVTGRTGSDELSESGCTGLNRGRMDGLERHDVNPGVTTPWRRPRMIEPP